MSDNFCTGVVSVPCFCCNPIKSTRFFSCFINTSLRQLGMHILLKPYIEQILFFFPSLFPKYVSFFRSLFK
jgi:hypothetical protein